MLFLIFDSIGAGEAIILLLIGGAIGAVAFKLVGRRGTRR